MALGDRDFLYFYAAAVKRLSCRGSHRKHYDTVTLCIYYLTIEGCCILRSACSHYLMSPSCGGFESQIYEL